MYTDETQAKPYILLQKYLSNNGKYQSSDLFQVALKVSKQCRLFY